MDADRQPDNEEWWKRLLQYFFQGIITIAPIVVTLYIVFWLFSLVDNFLPNILAYFFPSWRNADGTTTQIPGLGFILVVIGVILIGRLSSLFLVNRVFGIIDRLLEKTPGIKYIYTSVKDFLEAFGGNRKKFDKPVMVNVDAQPVWRIGFITQEDAAKFELPEHVAVYVPHSYAISGILYFIPKTHIRPLHNLSSAEAMKMIISGGLSHLDETGTLVTTTEEQDVIL